MSDVKEIKTAKKDKDLDKALGKVTRELRKMQPAVRMTTGPKSDLDVTEGEFMFSAVKKNSQAPGSPANDEGRMYFKMGGVLYQVTGTKV